MTDIQHGVVFRIFPYHSPVKIAWTDPHFGNGFLALDRNGNGQIDDGSELFGNLTPQPISDDPNGYKALAVFDQPANGGNNNGEIDPGDAIFSSLRIWIDANHNGFSERTELHPLSDLGIRSISLKYRKSAYTDQFGNQFRYEAPIVEFVGTSTKSSDKRCYDVFFKYDESSVKTSSGIAAGSAHGDATK